MSKPSSWHRLLVAAAIAALVAVAPGMFRALTGSSTASAMQSVATDYPPSTSAVGCTAAQMSYWVWDPYTKLWGNRCVGAGDTVLASEGDIVAIPNSANLQSTSPFVYSLIDRSIDVDAITAGASPYPIASDYVRGELLTSTSCFIDDTGCDKGLDSDPTDADIKAPDVGGSVGLYAVPVHVTSGTISFTWDVSRWAKGDVFAGLNGAVLKVYDKNFLFKRYVAVSDYENEEAQIITGCAANFATGEAFVTNFSQSDPAINVITRQPGNLTDPNHGDLPYADASRRLSTGIHRAEDPTGNYVDINPESVRFDFNQNMYVGHSGAYSTADGWNLDTAGRNWSTPDGTMVDIDGVTPLMADGAAGPLNWNALMARPDPTNLSTAYWEDQAAAWTNRVNPDPFAWLLRTVGGATDRIPFRRTLGQSLHRYNFTPGASPNHWTAANRDVMTPFVSQSGVDWIDLTAPAFDGGGNLLPPTMYYTSEYGDIYKYDTGTRTQLANFNGDQRLFRGKLHTVRLLPPGDGTDLLVTGQDVDSYLQAFDSQNPQHAIMRVRVDSSGVARVIQTYALGAADLVPMRNDADGELTGGVGQPSWYVLDVSPDGKTFWAAAHNSGDLYQFDVQTGSYRIQHAVQFVPATDDNAGRLVQGICIMWQYNTQQEICGNGIDDDHNGVVDDNCEHIPATLTGLQAGDDAYSTRENTLLTVVGGPNEPRLSANDGVDFNRAALTLSTVQGSAVGAGETVTRTTDQGGTLTLTVPDTSFTYQPALNFHGADTFKYTVTDGANVSNEATVTILVMPHVTDDAYTVSHAGAPILIARRQANAPGLLVNDSADPMTVTSAGSTSTVNVGVGGGVSFQSEQGATVFMWPDGSFQYTPRIGFSGADHFFYRANDGMSDATNSNVAFYGALATFAKVTVTVTNTNTPVAYDNSYSTAQWQPLLSDPSRNIISNPDTTGHVDTDADGDTLMINDLIIGGVHHPDRVATSSQPDGLDSCLAGGGQLKVWDSGLFEFDAQGSGCPFAIAPTTVSFQYTVTDGAATSNIATVSITVSGNRPPVAYDNAYSTVETSTLVRGAGNVITDPDSQSRLDFDPDSGDVLHLSQFWLGTDCLNDLADCTDLSPRVATTSATEDTCVPGGGQLKVWQDGTFEYNPEGSGCPFAVGPENVWFWYAVSDDKGATSNLAKVSITVTAPLFIAANDKARLYGQANPAFDATYAGFRNGDTPTTPGVLSGTLTCNTTVATSTSTPAGSYSILCSGQTSTRYTITYQQGFLTVGKVPLTVTASDTTKVYGTSNPVVSDTLSGFVNGDSAAVVTGSATCTTAGSAGPNVGAYAGSNTCTSNTLAATNYTFTTFVPGTLTITPAHLTVTAADTVKGYLSPNPAVGDTVTGFVNGETSAVVSGAPVCATSASAGPTAGTYPGANVCTVGTLHATNYDFPTFVAGKLTIAKAVLVVTATDTTKTYGAANPAVGFKIAGLLGGDGLSLITGAPVCSTSASAGPAVGTYTGSNNCTIGTLFALSYDITTFIPGTLTITPAVLTVKAQDKTKVYGTVNPALTSTITGFVNGDTSAVVTGAATLATAATQSSGVGGYPITSAVGTLAAPNYSFVAQPGTLTITPAVLTVQAGNGTRAYGAANPAFTSSIVGGFVNGDTSAVATGSAAVSTTATVGSPVASYPITAALGTLTAANYSFNFLPGTLTITSVPLTVTADHKTKVYDGHVFTGFTASYAGFVNGDTSSALGGALTFTGPATTAVAAGLGYVVTPGGLTSTNYSITFVNGTLDITQPVLALTKTVDHATAAPGDVLVYTIGYSNGGNASATNVVVRDVLPAHATFVSASNGGANSGGTVSWSLGTLAASASGSLTLTVKLDSAFSSGTTVIPNSATIASTEVPTPVSSPVATTAVTVAACATAPGAGALIRESTMFNAGSRTEGSVQMLTAANSTFNSNATLVGDLLIDGTPTVTVNGTPASYGGVTYGTGASTPTGHHVMINAGASLGHVVEHTDPVAFPTVSAPPSPTGTRNVTINSPSDNPGSFSTIQSLTINSNGGVVTVPAGNYGTFIANNNSSFILGVAGATTPAVYTFQSLTINSSGSLQIVGPVVVTVGSQQAYSGIVGASAHPEWLTLKVASGGLNLNASAGAFYGYVVAPNGAVIVNSGSQLVGGIIADSLTANSNAHIVLRPQATDCAANKAPMAVNDAYSTNMDTVLTVAASGVESNDSDPDGDSFTTHLVSGPAHGSVTLSEDGSFIYTPASGYVGADSFTYKVTDSHGADSNVATVTITVVNRPPAATTDSATVQGGSNVKIFVLANDSDPDGDTLTVTSATTPGHGTATINADETITYTPAAGFSGTDTFTYTISDGHGGTSTATVTITVAGTPNLQITKTVSKATAAPSDTLVYTLNYINSGNAVTTGVVLSDTLPLHTTFVSATAGGVNAGGTVSWPVGTLAAGASGTATVTVKLDATFPNGTTNISNTGVIQSTELPTPVTSSPVVTAVTVNSQCVIVSAGNNAYHTDRGTAFSISALGILGNDTDTLHRVLSVAQVNGQASNVGQTISTSHGHVKVSVSGAFTYTPSSSYTGTDTFTYRAQAPDGTLSNTATVTITVLGSHCSGDDRYSNGDDRQHYGDGSDTDSAHTSRHDGRDSNGYNKYNYDQSGFDRSGHDRNGYSKNDSRRYNRAGYDSDGYDRNGFDCNGRDRDGYDHNGYDRDGHDRYRDDCDHDDDDDAGEVCNNPPVAANDSYSVAGNTTLTVASSGGVLGNDHDVDGGTLTAVIVTNAAHGTVTLNANGSFTYVPTNGFVGTDTFTYKAKDPSGALSNLATATIVVTAPPCTGPNAANDSYSTYKNTALTIAASGVLGNDTDPQHHTLTATIVGQPSHGSITLNGNGGFVYTPATGFAGTDTFTYKASDGTLTDTATVTITVTNRAPVADNESYTATKNTVLTVAVGTGVLVGDSDPDGDSLTATSVTQPAHGSVSVNANGSFTYTPANGFVGTDTFTYKASDGTLTDTATVTITVKAPPCPGPTAVNDSYTTPKNTVLTVAAKGVLANDTDPQSDPLTVTRVSGPSHGSVTLNANGGFTYTPANNFVGKDTFTYKANDGTTNSNVATVSIKVDAPPVATNDAYSVQKNVTLTTGAPGVLTTDTDADGDAITAILVSTPSHGTLTLNADGSFVYKPASNYSGTDSFTYKAKDVTGATSNTATVTLTIQSHYDGDGCDHDRHRNGHYDGDGCDHDKAVNTGHHDGDGDDHDRHRNGHYDGDGCAHDRAANKSHYDGDGDDHDRHRNGHYDGDGCAHDRANSSGHFSGDGDDHDRHRNGHYDGDGCAHDRSQHSGH